MLTLPSSTLYESGPVMDPLAAPIDPDKMVVTLPAKVMESSALTANDLQDLRLIGVVGIATLRGASMLSIPDGRPKTTGKRESRVNELTMNRLNSSGYQKNSWWLGVLFIPGG